jgi:transposase
MVSKDNLAWFWQTNRRYLVGTPKAELKKWEKEIAEEKDWVKVREGLEVKLCTREMETYVLCRSEDRRKKEVAMHEKFTARIEEGLQSLKGRLENRKKEEDRSRVDRQIGRLLQRNSRAAGRFKIEVKEDAIAPAGLRLSWTKDTQWETSATRTEGCYVLRTNISGWTAESLWQAYIQLTDAEAAFRIQKSDLSIRPIWHRKKERVLAHIFVCFLAYAMWKTLEKWQERAGLGNSPRTILNELHRIQSADVVLPLADYPGREVRLRCVVRPEPAQAQLLDRLGLRLPERLKRRELLNAERPEM